MKSKRDVLHDLHEYSICVDDRLLYLCGDINEDKAEQFLKNFHYLAGKSEENIYVILDSPGGSITRGLAIYDCIKSFRNIPVIIEATGDVMSMAVALLQAGDQRSCTRHTRFMIHQGSNELPALSNNELRAETAESLTLAKIYEDILLTRIREKNPKFPAKRFREMLDKTTFFSAEVAISLGLVDEVAG
jgi:ATP-dependent Clp protease protease subunit